MSLSAATSRLRRMVLYRLIVRSGRAGCFRCHGPILSVENLRVDHKEPWLDVSADLFWRLDNVAFAHIRCNGAARRPARFSDADRRKREQLGMPIGTATNRLIKQVMFDLLRELDELTCFRCQDEISTPIELSIEHTVPWIGEAPSVFWDLDLISFSHLRCNSGAFRLEIHSTPAQRRLNGEHLSRKMAASRGFIPGTAWCGGRHQGYVTITNFAVNRGRSTGVQSWCRDCRSAWRSTRRREVALAALQAVI